MDISNAILEGGFCWGGCGFFFLVLFGVSLSMPADDGKVREKRFSLKKAKRIIIKRELSKTEERRISIWMSFFFGLSLVIFGIVDLYTSPTGNPFRNLTYSTIKIIFGGLAWVGTGYLCWQQRPLLGGLSFFLLGSSLILLGIMEVYTSPPAGPFYGPHRYLAYALSNFIMGGIMWGIVLYLCWKTVWEKAMMKERIRAFYASRRLPMASHIAR